MAAEASAFKRTISGRNDAGAIHGVKNPSSNGSLPAWIWQSFDIIFRAPRWDDLVKVENARASVWFNGILVQSDTEIPKSTVGGRAESPRPGPIMLQDHDNKVQFRNIWIQRL